MGLGMRRYILAFGLSGIAMSLIAFFIFGVNRYKLPDDLEFQTTILANENSPDIVNIIYVHGINCHNPGYSTPVHYRLIDTLNRYVGTNYKRSIEQSSDGAFFFEYYEFEDPTNRQEAFEGRVSKFLRSKPAIKVHDVTSFDQFKRSWWNHVIPTSTGRKKSFKAHLKRAIRNANSEPVPEDWWRYDRFSDFCDDRHDSNNQAVPTNGALGSGVLIREFDDESTGKKVRFVEVLWSPVSEKVKRHWLGYDYVSRPVIEQENKKKKKIEDQLVTPISERSVANKQIKDSVMNSGFPDAVYYVGEGRSAVLSVVETALCFGFLDEPENAYRALAKQACPLEGDTDNSAVEFYAESLGSRVLFDAISSFALSANSEVDKRLEPFGESSAEADRLGWEFSGRSEGSESANPAVFLFANQFPLLEIGIGQYRRSDYRPLGVDEYLDVVFEKLPNVDEPQRFVRSFNSETQSIRCLMGLKLWDHYRARSFSIETPESYLSEGGIASLYNQAHFAVKELEVLMATRAICADGLQELRSSRLTGSVLSEGQVSDEYLGESMLQSYEAMTLHSLIDRELDGGPAVLDAILKLANYKNLVTELESLITDEDVGCAEYDYIDVDALEEDYEVGAFGFRPIKINKWEQSCNQRAVDIIEGYKSDRLRVMAFSDSNDLLTYEIPEAFSERLELVDFQDIPLRITLPFPPFRGNGGVFANPINAHTNYRFSIFTMKWIVCGDPDCKPVR